MTMTQKLASRVTEVAVADVVVSAGYNPRRDFDEGMLFTLGRSMEQVSQLAPVILNRVDEQYYLVAGERRLRAARDAGQAFIEAKIFDNLDAVTMMRMQLAENRERVELNAIERARAWAAAIEVGISDTEVAAAEGLSVETLRRQVKLLSLPDDVQRLMLRAANPLPIHQALCLVGLEASDQLSIARRAAPVSGRVASEEEVRAWASGARDKDQPDLPGAKPRGKRGRPPGRATRLSPEPPESKEGVMHRSAASGDEESAKGEPGRTGSAKREAQPAPAAYAVLAASGPLTVTGPDSFIIRGAKVDVELGPFRVKLVCDVVLEGVVDSVDGSEAAKSLREAVARIAMKLAEAKERGKPGGKARGKGKNKPRK